MCWNKQGWISVFILLTFGGTLFTNYKASTNIGDISRKYELPITPASWTFTIWAFIYTWQALWQLYLIFFSIKYSNVLDNSVLFKYIFYIFWVFSNILNGAWIIVWSNESVIGAAILLVLTTLALYVVIFVSHKYTMLIVPYYSNNESYNTELLKFVANNKIILNCLYGFVLNGIPFYATWCTIASCLNVGIAFTYSKSDFGRNTSSVMMLSVLSLIIAAYWTLDFWLLRSYLRYTFTPYIVLIVAFCGVITNDYPFEAPKIFVTILLGVAIVGTIVKIIVSAVTIRKSNQEDTQALV